MRTVGLLSACAAALLLAGPAGAAPVQITGYDITQTPASGFGLWTHSYDGNVTPTGRFYDQSSTAPDAIVDETGGGGTLNDGVIGSTIDEAHLLLLDVDRDGLPIRPTITLRLAQSVRVQSLLIHGGLIEANAAPGALSEATITIGDASATLASTPEGIDLGVGPVDDRFDLSGTPLAEISTRQVELSGFAGAVFGSPYPQFSITEVGVDAIASDTTPPRLRVPSSPVRALTGDPAGVRVQFAVSAQDAVDGPVEVSCSPPSGSRFAPGNTRVVCRTSDAAGNVATATFTVFVRLTASGLCRLTGQYVSSSSRYQALPPAGRRAIDRLVVAACRHLDGLVATLTPKQKAALVDRYRRSVDVLRAGGWVTTGQAATLKILAGAI